MDDLIKSDNVELEERCATISFAYTRGKSEGASYSLISNRRVSYFCGGHARKCVHVRARNRAIRMRRDTPRSARGTRSPSWDSGRSLVANAIFRRAHLSVIRMPIARLENDYGHERRCRIGEATELRSCAARGGEAATRIRSRLCCTRESPVKLAYPVDRGIPHGNFVSAELWLFRSVKTAGFFGNNENQMISMQRTFMIDRLLNGYSRHCPVVVDKWLNTATCVPLIIVTKKLPWLQGIRA